MGEKIFTAELNPSKVLVHVYSHTISVQGILRPCVTLVTEGLMTQKQQELVCTFLIDQINKADYQTLMQYIGQVYQFASQGRVVNDDGISGFKIPNLFGRS